MIDWLVELSKKNDEGMTSLYLYHHISFTVVSSNTSCEARFCPTLEGNKQKIDSYNFCKAEPYMNQLKSHTISEVLTGGQGSSKIEIPVFVTGTSSNHFQESLLMLKELNKVVRPAYPMLKLYFFDFGLRNSEVIQVCMTSKIIRFLHFITKTCHSF